MVTKAFPHLKVLLLFIGARVLPASFCIIHLSE
jgi:hypothetical protein